MTETWERWVSRNWPEFKSSPTKRLCPVRGTFVVPLTWTRWSFSYNYTFQLCICFDGSSLPTWPRSRPHPPRSTVIPPYEHCNILIPSIYKFSSVPSIQCSPTCPCRGARRELPSLLQGQLLNAYQHVQCSCLCNPSRERFPEDP